MNIDNEISKIKDYSFFNRAIFLFENNRNVNSIFINEIKDKEFSDFSKCVNIKFDNVNACISLDDTSSDGIYISTMINTHENEDSFMNNFFLIVDEEKPIGTDIYYYILTDENEKIKIVPNSNSALILNTIELPKNFKIRAELKNNNTLSPKINSLAVMYYDTLTDENLGLQQPSVEREYDFKAVKSHTHENKEVLDTITSTKITYWNSKSDFNGDYNNLTNKPIIPTPLELDSRFNAKANTDQIPTKLGELSNDVGYISFIPDEYVTEYELNNKGYLTEHQDITGKVDKIEGKTLTSNDLTNILKTNYDNAYTHSQSNHFNGDYNSLNNKPIIPSIDGLASETFVTNKVSEVHSHSNLSILSQITIEKITSWDNKTNFNGDYNSLTNKPTIFNGDYNSLTNKPTIPVVDVTKLYVDNELINKVDKVNGMGLSQANFTTSEKTKLSTVLTHATMTQAQYDALSTKDSNTIYFIIG